MVFLLSTQNSIPSSEVRTIREFHAVIAESSPVNSSSLEEYETYYATINNNRIGSLNPLKMKGKKRKKDGINSLNDYTDY